MQEILSYLTLRTFLVFASTAFSLLFVMLALNIITVDEAVTILHMSPDAAQAFKLVVSRVQEITGNILDIISQLLNKLFGWAGLDVDLNRIKVDVNHGAAAGSAGAAPAPVEPLTHGAGGGPNSVNP